MPERGWSAAEVLAALERSRGDLDRGVLIIALAEADGAYPRRMVEMVAREGTAVERSSALISLRWRFGEEVLPLCNEAVSSRSPHLRFMAAMILSEMADRLDDLRPFLAWRDKRFGRPSRLNNWSWSELPAVIEFAARTGTATELSIMLRKWRRNLSGEEVAYLASQFPSLLEGSPEEVERSLGHSETLIAQLRQTRNEYGDPVGPVDDVIRDEVRSILG